LNVDQIRQLIDTEPDFVNLRRYGNSLEKVIEAYPDGAPDKVISQALLMTPEEIEELYEEVVLKLRVLMKVDA
jgi:hypothetical protein